MVFRKRKRHQLAFRIGNVNAAGGQPISSTTRTIKSVTANVMLISGTTAGDTCAFNICDWSAPSDPDANTTFTFPGTENNKPNNQPEADAEGYDAVRVLSALYRFDVRYKGTSDPTKDFIFAYAFNTQSTAPLTLTASATIAADNWNDLRCSRGWVWHRMSATAQSGSLYPAAKRIEVRIPNIMQLTNKLDQDENDDDVETFYHAVTTGIDSAASSAFLHIVIMNLDGVAFTAGDIAIDVTVYQKVHLTKNRGAGDIIDEQVPEA